MGRLEFCLHFTNETAMKENLTGKERGRKATLPWIQSRRFYGTNLRVAGKENCDSTNSAIA